VATLFEYLLTLYRLDERARAYFITTIANVVATIALTVILVVGVGDGARGLLLGSYLTGAAFVAVLIFEQRRRLTLRIEVPLLRRLLRFGLPTMPAEVSLYLLNLVDRVIIIHVAGPTQAGIYSVGVKFAQAVNVLVRGFQLAWPPLAYSIRDDDEARRTYATVITLFLAACTWLVVGLWLLAQYLIRLFAAPKFFDAYEVVGLIAAAVTLYALYMVMVVVLGRTGRTEYNFPAAIAALVSNVALNLLLVPPLGIVGAGLALVGSYLVVVALMYWFTERLFPVPYEWGRLARVLFGAAALIALGELVMPTSGFGGLAGRFLLALIYPLVLLASGFFTDEERGWLAYLRHPRELAASFAAVRARPAAVDGDPGEIYEAERMDEDSRF
jgi:O-antigen/teichoic acid export membrane protein